MSSTCALLHLRSIPLLCSTFPLFLHFDILALTGSLFHLSSRCFCVGVSTAFGIVTRLDNLMLATKELVGEQYHIHGVGYVSKTGGVEMQSRTSSLRPSRDV